ncbi:MAG: cation diffusion facilitator family transporter [Sediminimonas sp.]|uniref:cation diffusion facilitator family transporter n=1 Tax=Sediminimonas sp. TaxID=2823379 RepID=UPI0028700FD6|nr:cation diffusion facilitator family transporter [Sediminimonas sp.]MDR9484086.1 cation diffusion facilitator family transporter [Sediminimonas sp.]
MPHDHGHGHAHMDPASGDRRVALAIWANMLLTVAQIIGGVLSGSLALIADAIHNFSDMASLVIAYGAGRIARRPADSAMTFGYGRIEMVAALINYTTLILIGVYLVYEGGMRLIDPPQVAGWTVVILGGVALAVDTLTAGLTWSMQKGSANIRALFLHNLSDALASLAVVGGGALILLYDWRLVDPLVTLAIAGYILFLSIREIGGPIRMLMLGSPPGFDAHAVLDAVRATPGVESVHHAHFWQMQEHAASLDTHVVIDNDAWPRQQQIKEEIKHMLGAQFDIHHSTLELERADDAHSGAALFGRDGGCGH